MRPGQRERKEFEYLRHGTQTADPQVASGGKRRLLMIASFDVARGAVIQGSVGATRTERLSGACQTDRCH